MEPKLNLDSVGTQTYCALSTGDIELIQWCEYGQMFTVQHKGEYVGILSATEILEACRLSKKNSEEQAEKRLKTQ